MTITDDNYFDHEADIGVIGRGETIEKAFINAAEALFAIMVEDLGRIKRERSVSIEFTESDPEIALVTWLNLLVGEARSNDLVFGGFELKRDGDKWKGRAQGETWTDAIVRGTEVKGATLTALSVKKKNRRWEAGCVVDV